MQQASVFMKHFEAARSEWFHCEELSQFTAKAVAFVKGLEPWIIDVAPENEFKRAISWSGLSKLMRYYWLHGPPSASESVHWALITRFNLPFLHERRFRQFHALSIFKHGGLERKSWHSITIQALRDIPIDEEITANYGEALGKSFFADLCSGCPCLKCCPPVKPEPSIGVDNLVVSNKGDGRVIDKVQRSEAVKQKTARRCQQKAQKRRAMGGSSTILGVNPPPWRAGYTSGLLLAKPASCGAPLWADDDCGESVPKNWEYGKFMPSSAKIVQVRISHMADSHRDRRVWEYLINRGKAKSEDMTGQGNVLTGLHSWEHSWLKIGAFLHPSAVDSFWKVARTQGRDTRDLYLFDKKEVIKRDDEVVPENGGPGCSSAGFMAACMQNPDATKVYALLTMGATTPGGSLVGSQTESPLLLTKQQGSPLGPSWAPPDPTNTRGATGSEAACAHTKVKDLEPIAPAGSPY
ncbi:hypothetical protein FB451DRAFT_1195798 [Mycena latifolia]|nr:hypothetical protein FB451DRAFT_1195798 [Mycena latifolia]